MIISSDAQPSSCFTILNVYTAVKDEAASTLDESIEASKNIFFIRSIKKLLYSLYSLQHESPGPETCPVDKSPGPETCPVDKVVVISIVCDMN